MIMARSVLEVIITEKIQSPANEHGKDKTLNAKLRDAAKEGVSASEILQQQSRMSVTDQLTISLKRSAKTMPNLFSVSWIH